MNPEEHFTAFQDAIFTSVMTSVQTSGRIAAEDVSFQRSSNPDFSAALDETSARVLALVNRLMNSASRGSDLAAPKVQDTDDVDTKWSDVVEVVDFMLEKADTCLDEYTGAIKHKNPEPLPGALINTPQRGNVGRIQKANSWKSRQMAKPQLKFEATIDNFNTSPFHPIIRTKPHAVVPLEDSIRLEPNKEGVEQFTHPYKVEIETMEYPSHIYENQKPIMYRPFEETTAAWVDTKETLDEMIYELKRATEIAVDLEHHDARSYIGFTCLMQISTRDNDWIIDTLSLRLELQALNEVFADPKIIKVLHGCYMDVKWLQRDFGLYLVGLFDTHFAAKVLGFPGLGLAYLLKKYVGFHADKAYQLADWRIRPLTPEMFNYARSDTHFLLYIFDCIRNELVDRSDPSNPEEDRMQRVLQDSREAALKRYERDTYDAKNGSGPGGWYQTLFRGHLDNVQEAVFKAVHQWRDTAAREEDEGLHYTLPKHQMTNLARQMPADVNSLLRLCQPTSSIVRARAGDLVAIIRHAKNNAPIQVDEEEQDPSPVAEPMATIPAEPVAETRTLMNPKNNVLNPKYALANVFESKPAITPEIYAEKSTFWGVAYGSSKWEAIRSAKTGVDGDVRLAIPLPQLTAAVFVTAEEQLDGSVKKAVDPGARAEHEYIKAADRQMRKEDDIIVVKTLGGAKKRRHEKVSGEQNHRQSDAIPQEEMQYVGDSHGEILQEPGEGSEQGSERKRNKKERHRARGEDGSEDRRDLDTEDDKTFQAFDYSRAPLVLNSHKQQKTGGKDGKQQKQKKAVFDPYTKSGDAPRGMSRSQRERSGKSHTFKQ